MTMIAFIDALGDIMRIMIAFIITLGEAM